ncbi:MAG: transaldolase [Desulfobacteraceae bacterium]|nr:transaldolase [Desulfobacteraceae bacterium]
MSIKSVIERFWEINPESEIWWDSSPIIYDNWRKKMIDQASDKDEMKEWLDRLYSKDNKPEENIFRGVTTNPPLSYSAIKDNPAYWVTWIDDQIEKDRSKPAEVVFWDTYKEIVRRGAEVYLPTFEASGYKFGFISGQVDPRVRHDVDTMVAQGVELHSLSPNVMIKVPGTAEGYEVIRQLTAKGIPTNNTLSFMISQFVACMNAVVDGMKEAEKNGVDLSKWRSVITFMSGRFGTLGDLQKEARELKIELSEADERWAEIAVFKKACRLVDENSEYPGKMLLCSMKMSPQVDGVVRSWHIEKVAGANAVYTCPPPYLEGLLFKGQHLEFSDQINDPVPGDVMDKLMKIPYFERGYAEDGYTAEEFNSYTPLLATAKQFSGATQEMVDFVTKRVTKS